MENVKKEKTLAEYKLEALRSQMDPHFIFNAITAVQNFILTNEKRAAIEYLDVVSHLIRKFLEHSKVETIPLSEEMELLIAYINLESMRFSDKFGFIVHVDEELDPNEVEIPSMLIQPFVENAIKHGLLHKKEYGLIQIKFHLLPPKILHVIVEDNGVGRKKSNEINSWKPKKHQSLAIQLTHERLQILNELNGNQLNLTIEDVYPNQEETGTRVHLYIPINYSYE